MEQLQPTHVEALVTGKVTESHDLDFKAGLYGTSDADKRDLAGDVAALANTAGGVIVLGIQEGEHAQAISAPGVEVSDAEVARIRQIVADRVSPMPTFDVISVQNLVSPATSHGPLAPSFLLIAVPRSANAPHAVMVSKALRYPKRNGATTRYLSESEVFSAYRERISSAARQDSRLSLVMRDAEKRIDRDYSAWMLLGLVPDQPGDFLISATSAQEFSDQVMDKQALLIIPGIQFCRTKVGRRRLLADGTHNTHLARHASLDLHTDGAGVFGLGLPRLRSEDPVRVRGGEELSNQIDEQLLAIGVLTGLWWLAGHACNRAATGGNALIRAAILPAAGGEPFGIERFSRSWGERHSPVVQDDVIEAEAFAQLDELIKPGPESVATAAQLLDELSQAFGLPEAGQFTRDGLIRRQGWQESYMEQVGPWAKRQNVSFTDLPLP